MGKEKVYFFCYPHGPADRAGYEHEMVCIAEGLRALGIAFSGNIDYWREGNRPDDFLIRKDPGERYKDADIVIFSSVAFNYEATSLLPKDLFSPHRRYRLIFIDASDGLVTPGFGEQLQACDLVLKCHCNRKYSLPSNFHPWAFGLSTRIIDQLSGAQSPVDDGNALREPTILVNYRVDLSLRERAAQRVIPLFDGMLRKDDTVDSFDPEGLSSKDRLLWTQTGRRHYPAYYRRLKASLACSCFGGHLAKCTDNREGKVWDLIRRADNRLSFLSEDRVYQFDSWRLWESFAAGACVLHVDLQKYGCVLPVMPVNMVHYLGFDLGKPEDVVSKVRNDPALIGKIGEEGKAWALKNYSPKAVAERLLELAG